jgi:hypothetical protein
LDSIFIPGAVPQVRSNSPENKYYLLGPVSDRARWVARSETGHSLNFHSPLGTIYAQLLAGQSAHHIAGYAQLSAGVADEGQRLQDQLEAWREVKLRRG